MSKHPHVKQIRMAGHTDKVVGKTTGLFHSLTLTGTAQHEQGFLGKTRSIHFQLN